MKNIVEDYIYDLLFFGLETIYIQKMKSDDVLKIIVENINLGKTVLLVKRDINERMKNNDCS